MFDFHSTTLLKEFKQFVNQGNDQFKLDFRTHAYLENNVGLLPVYRYESAEIIINHLFLFLEKFHVKLSNDANKRAMIESLRLTRLNVFIANILSNKISKEKLAVMKVTKAPKPKLDGVSLADFNGDNCLFIDIDVASCNLMAERLSIPYDCHSENNGGFIKVQFPVTCESKIYIAGGVLLDDVYGYQSDELMVKLINGIITKASRTKVCKDYELEEMFSTTNIKEHPNGVNHNYLGGLYLTVLENLDSKEAYVTFERLHGKGTVIYPCDFKVFDSFSAAIQYIRGHCEKFNSLSDYLISHNIYKEISSVENTKLWL